MMNLDPAIHAYLIRASDTTVVTDALEDHGFKTRGNPDFYSVSFDTMLIDDARAVTEYASLAPLGERKYILIQARHASVPAQTALLKSLEEGTGRSIFFIVLEPGAYIIPTLVSRCVVLTQVAGGSGLGAAEEFIQLSYKDRLALAEKFGKDKDREGARALVRSLLALSGQQKFTPTVLRDLLDADRYLGLSGSSPKSVIGHLALVL